MGFWVCGSGGVRDVHVLTCARVVQIGVAHTPEVRTVWECVYYSREQKKSKQPNRHTNTSRNWQQTSELHTRRPGNNHSGKGMLCCHGCARTQKFGKGTAVLPAFWGMPVEFCSCCEESMSTNPGSNQKRSYGLSLIHI